ncbi:MAG TPA: LPS assembly protein LptD [Gammaproteobacteria bacterium]|nr:LPS assembly protein LptD [Gammaproteobacteria bacterium]
MKAGRAFFLITALLASAPALADDTASPNSYMSTAQDMSGAPASSTSPEAMMARAFEGKSWTCISSSPGQSPSVEPAPRNETACTLSPFYHDSWGLCPAFPASPVLPLPPGSPLPGQQQAFIIGDQIDGIQQGQSFITGDVQLDQGDHRVTGQKMTYDSNTGIALIKEDVNYYTPRLMVLSPSGSYDTNKGFGSFDDAEFLLPQRHGRGTADLVNSLDTDHSQMFGVQYTTCPPGHQDWLLKAPDLSLDMSTNTGIAHDVTIDFLGVPIFWTPYLNFPITDDRKSGFLSTEFSFDAINGFEIEAPYYFNLAPNYDLTLYPRPITKRGLQTGADFQILTPISYDYIYGSYMPHDMVYDKEYGVTGNHERGQFTLKHNMIVNDNTSLTGDYNWVSDDEYFHDLSSDLSIVSSTYLNRNLKLKYGDGSDLHVATLMQDYQVIDPNIARTSYPYRRAPEVTIGLGNNSAVEGPEYTMDTEVVRFQRSERLGAWRFDTEPSVSFPMSSYFGYFTPTLAWRYTEYDLSEQQQANLAPGSLPLQQNPFLDDAHFSRSVPIFDIDSGLYFDRDIGDGSYLQTLEPRLFYLRVPYRNQNEIPIFDALGTTFSYAQLFSDNNFYGADRQSDANQLSYALTSRLLDPTTGAEILRGDIGQIRYLADRKVSIGTACTSSNIPIGCTPAATFLFSDIVGDLAYSLNDEWTVTHQQLWNPATRKTDLANVLFEYHPAYRQVVNLGYQYQRGANNNPLVKQTDFSFSWPLTTNWSMVGRWNYDISSNPHLTLEDFIGLEYDSCCWNFQILHRHVVTGTRGGQPLLDNVFFFQLSLKGLVTAGRHLDDLVESGILGYSDNAFTESQ